MFKFLKNQSGQGIIEALIGGAIIAITATGLGVAINHMGKSRAKTQTVANAVALESVIVGSLQDPGSYSATMRTALQNGDVSQFQSGFQMPAPNWGPGFIRIGTTTFKQDGTLCSSTLAGSTDCALAVNLQFRSLGGAPPQYAFAYQIQTNHDNVNMAPLGAPMADDNADGYGDTFANDAYRMIVPSSIFNNNIVCDSGIAASGFNFEQGRLTCLDMPAASLTCPAGQFPVGLQLDPANPGIIQFKCQALRQVGCRVGNIATDKDQYYGLSQFDPATLDTRKDVTESLNAARCTFVAAATQPALTGSTGASRATYFPIRGTTGSAPGGYRFGIKGVDSQPMGTFCPTGYDAIITECVAVLDDPPGIPTRCPTGYPGGAAACAAATTGLPASGVWYGPPASGLYTDPLVAPINVGTTVQSAVGNQASCLLNNGGQPAGAGWTGYVNMTVSCQVNLTQLPATTEPKLIN